MITAEIVFFQLIVLIFSVIIHEISHGSMANHLGDPTAKMAGRLSLNPLKHLDFFGSFVVPLTLWLMTHGGFVLGWAKPVPFNTYNLKDQKYGKAKVAIAGPGANFALALASGLILRFLPPEYAQFFILGKFLSIIVIVNLLLAFFNLVPIPPLDGSKVLFTFLPARYWKFEQLIERYSLLILIIFVSLFSGFLSPLIFSIYKLIVGHMFFLT